ncbi:ATP-binding cassette domain-containing protein [Streptomyces sp. WG5]|uniref:class III lanthionine synthetase LanKC N-terminal domain-containing protein n=1 Tax=Streptomyces sp. WG5 TaxID=3417648 RepID=UPI003CFB6771
MADRTFFDSPWQVREGEYSFAAADRELPEGWRKVVQDDWLVCTPEGTRRPSQGWKIHASGCQDNAEKILDAVWDFCVPRGIPFKFLRGRHILQLRNMKYAPRGGSGKFVTVYPADEAELREVLDGVDAVVGGEPGAYILSDLRWNQGPLYVRYGGFVERHVVSEKGVLEPAVERPDGTLVPDRRRPGFHVPDWVTLPEFLEPHAEVAAVDEVGAAPLVSRLGGIGALIDPATLSSGERQQIALARAYLSPAPLVVLDEATCHLDPAAEARAEEAFARRPGSLVVIAHRISSARRARHVLVLDGGRVVSGVHHEVLERSPLYRDLVGHWSDDEHDPSEADAGCEEAPVGNEAAVRATPPRSRS